MSGAYWSGGNAADDIQRGVDRILSDVGFKREMVSLPRDEIEAVYQVLVLAETGQAKQEELERASKLLEPVMWPWMKWHANRLRREHKAAQDEERGAT